MDLKEFDTKQKEKENQPKPIGLEAMCWSCNKIWNISLLPTDAKAVKCDCGGYVVTESGKAMSRPIFDQYDSRAPLIEYDNQKKIILLDDVL